MHRGYFFGIGMIILQCKKEAIVRRLKTEQKLKQAPEIQAA